jgi:hypothetical protein
MQQSSHAAMPTLAHNRTTDSSRDTLLRYASHSVYSRLPTYDELPGQGVLIARRWVAHWTSLCGKIHAGLMYQCGGRHGKNANLLNMKLGDAVYPVSV